MMINMQHDERDPTNYVDWDPWARSPCPPHGPYGYWQGSPLHDHDHHHPNHRQNHHHHWTRIIIPRSLSHLRQSNWSSSTLTSVDSKSLTSAKAMLTKTQGSYSLSLQLSPSLKVHALWSNTHWQRAKSRFQTGPSMFSMNQGHCHCFVINDFPLESGMWWCLCQNWRWQVNKFNFFSNIHQQHLEWIQKPHK